MGNPLNSAPGSKQPLAEMTKTDYLPAWQQAGKISGNLELWESFNWDRHPKLRAAKRIIVDWYNGLPDSGALVLSGDVGCGKTHIADAIANLYGRWQVSSWGEISLTSAIQATYDKNSNASEDSIWRELGRAKLIILDDLGTYNTANDNWISNIYGRLFNDYVTIRGKPILITTNLRFFGEGGLETRLGPRSFSRLCDALGDKRRFIDWSGLDDYRIERMLNG